MENQMLAKLKASRLIDTMVVETMLAGINLSKTIGSLYGRIKRAINPPKEKFLSDDPFLREEKNWRQVIASHLTGKILVDLGVISSEQLAEALKRQKELLEKGKRKSLGVLLVEMGYSTSKDYLDALSRYFDMPVISLLKFIPSTSMQGVVAEQYAYYNKLLVLADYETEVKLAVSEPNPIILEELKKTFRRKEIKFYLANPFELERCYRLYLDPFSSSFYR
jgi:hypothetical protein